MKGLELTFYAPPFNSRRGAVGSFEHVAPGLSFGRPRTHTECHAGEGLREQPILERHVDEVRGSEQGRPGREQAGEPPMSGHPLSEAPAELVEIAIPQVSTDV